MIVYFNKIIGKFQEKIKILVLIFSISFFVSGCGWLVVGGSGAYHGYKVGSDPRSVGTQIDDATITAKIKLKLLEDPVTKARKIDVDTVNGVVTLTGVVESEKEIERAIKIAKSVAGVKKVVNNLKIGKRGIGSYLSDKEITAKIKLKLIKDPELTALSIDVDTINGVVTLTGVVTSEYQKRKAIEHAKSVSGVIKIIDNLQIKR
ncbi:MAG: Osmotically-inducible protein OsmY [Thermodesulfobacterium sp.]|uniref:Osmotically-inducible protein OsmY n=1 Tax=Candidatus Thermodesulfobacterium syntrophicum TaxID=3060442 RepID=A0AAE3TEC1_9BACT|nr:Osmotically-inducible protein OsmY [Candidatus Thermodesulfobacterium syntrophicum]